MVHDADLRRLPNRARQRLGRSFTLFKMTGGPVVQRLSGHGRRVRELHNAMSRHDGLFYLAARAGFVPITKRKRSARFGRLFKLIAISTRSSLAVAMKILEHRQSTSRGNGWASSAPDRATAAATSRRMTAGSLWLR